MSATQVTMQEISDLRLLPHNSCAAVVWSQLVCDILGIVTFSAIIIFLALSPMVRDFVLNILLEKASVLLPNSRKLSQSIQLQLNKFVISDDLDEYSYQSYQICKGLKLGKTISSLLIYNGSIYFLCTPLADVL
ncbi:hypothetical protein V8D89_001210 [Ganoderma adspersum]